MEVALSFTKMLSVGFLVQAIFTTQSFAQEFIDLVEVGTSKNSDPFQARKAIQEEIVNRVSNRYISEFIGEKKVQKNQNLINAKIIKNSGKYIPTIKVGKLENAGGGQKQMSVSLKISVKNLKQMLLEEGLLYEQEGPATVLPMIAIVDKSHLLAYRWWVADNDKSKNFLHQQLAALHTEIAKSFKHQGFYLRNPLSTGEKNLIPQAFQIDALRMEDYMFLGEFFKSQIILKGDIRFEPGLEGSEFYKIQLRLTAVHTGNGRVVAEVIRTLDTEPGLFERVIPGKLEASLPEVATDLASQMHEAWQKGTFGARLVKLTLRGPIEYKNLAKFKDQVEQKLGEIKSIRERLFEPKQVTFEVDTSTSTDALTEKFRRTKFDGFLVEVDGSANDTIALKLNFQ